MKLSKAEVRRLAVNAQLLAGPRPPATAEGLLEVARALRCIQIDAVGAVGAVTQLLVPLSRLGPYPKEDLDRLLYEDRVLFHYFAHAASLVLTEDFEIHAGRMRPYGLRLTKWSAQIAEWMDENRELREQILAEIARRGPLRSRDFENTSRTDWRSSGWTEGRSVNRMLDFLWSEGVLTVAGRSGQERLWDLSERWFPGWTPRRELTPEEMSDRAVAHALRALGAATPRQVNLHFLRQRYPDLKGSFQRLAASGEVVALETPELKDDWFLHRDSLPLLEAAWLPRTVLLSPFDNLIADRRRTLELWDFDYVIEIYVPAAKRKRGYYAMPILEGERLIGTVDPSFDRKAKVLKVNRVVLEAGASMTPATAEAIAELATFVGAEGVAYS